MSHKYPGGIRECFCGSHYVHANGATANKEVFIACMFCERKWWTGETSIRFALKKWNNREIDESEGVGLNVE